MEALQYLRERNKSGDKKAYYDAIEKELKELERLRKLLESKPEQENKDEQ